MFNAGDIYRIIQEALNEYEVYSEDSKLGDGSIDSYEIDTEFISGDDGYLSATVKHCHEHYPWQPGDDEIDITRFKINVEIM